MDKVRIKTLLKAWSRSISDRYLDLNLISRLDFRSHCSESDAYNLLRQNAPVGAVMFIMNEVGHSRHWLVENQRNGVYAHYNLTLS